METVERLLRYFANENTFNRYNSTELTSLINEIGRKLTQLDNTKRYELLNSLYYNTKSNGYSSLLHVCFSRMRNDPSLKYTLWKAIYIFCELGLNPINVNYMPPNQIKLKHSMKESLNLLREINEENEIKEMKTRILTLKSQESMKSIGASSSYSTHCSSTQSTPSSVEFNIGDIDDVFGDIDNINYSNSLSCNVKHKKISPFHNKLKLQPRSWTDLQLNLDDNDNITKRNIIQILKYCNQYKYNNYQCPAIATIYVNLTSLSSCLTILGNAFISLKQFNPNMFTFTLCKLENCKILSIVDNISYYDHNKMNKYGIDMKKSIHILKHNINIAYKQVSYKRYSNYLCYLYLIKMFYKKFKKQSWKRFIINKRNNSTNIKLNDRILNLIQLYTFEDMNYFNLSNEIENKWMCIWFDTLSNNNIYNKKWIDWICKNILKKLTNGQKDYLSDYIVKRTQNCIKNCSNYQLKCCMLDILGTKLKYNNFDDNDITSYINPKWFLNNIVFTDTKLIQKLLIYCINHNNYKDLCVNCLWFLLTNSSFYIRESFFDEMIQIIINFSNNNKYFVNGCCQNLLYSIFSIRSHLLQNNTYAQKNITLFLLNISSKNKKGILNVDINKGLMQCVTSQPGNSILLKILISNNELLNFNICMDKGYIEIINNQIEYIQNQTIKNIYTQWYTYNTKLLQFHNSNHSNHSNHSLPTISNTISNQSMHSTNELNVCQIPDDQCAIM